MKINTLLKKAMRYFFRFNIIENSIVHKKSVVFRKCKLKNVSVEKYTYFGENCSVFNAIIGSYCSIANNVIIGSAEHDLRFVSTSPVFFRGRNLLGKNLANTAEPAFKMVQIGNDVWIGNNVLIKQGVKIGNGAIVAMGSVVTKDVPSYSIVGGVPAKIIRFRFNSETINQMEKTQWWNLTENELKKHLIYFCEPELFAKTILLNKGKNE